MFSTATGWLIVANVAIWAGMVAACALGGAFGAGLWAPFPGKITLLLGANVPPLDLREPWRLITSAFLHAGLLHVAMNMLMLWYLGLRLEGAFGHARFLVLYLASALGGALLSGGWHGIVGGVSVGASGAVMGVLGGLFALTWKGRGFRDPITQMWWKYAVIGFVMGIVSNLVGAGGLDNAAHIGGWAAGIGTTLLFAGRRPWSAGAQRFAVAGSAVLVAASFVATLTLAAPEAGLAGSHARKDAMIAIDARDWNAAERALAQAILEEPQDMNLHLARAQVLDEGNRKDEATAELGAAARLDGSADEFGQLAEMLKERGDTGGARKAAAAARLKDPGNPRFARLYEEMKAADQAAAH